MDMKRFTEIGGREAANRLLDDLDVYSEGGNRYYMQDGTVWMKSGELAGHVRLTIAETLSREWFVKKPFDVRAEMLARPNEWVGAFQTGLGVWYKVGFDKGTMKAVEDKVKNESSARYTFKSGVRLLRNDALDNCIPIEDVPKEEI